MNFILFDDAQRHNLYPFTLSRPVCEIRAGILTLKQKWDKYLGIESSYHTVNYLSGKYPPLSSKQNGKACTFINGSVFPTKELLEAIHQLQANTALVKGDKIIAVNCAEFQSNFDPNQPTFNNISYAEPLQMLEKPWEIFTQNGKNIEGDFEILNKNRSTEHIDASNQVICPENIFIEEGAVVRFSILNASAGPIYIGKDAEVMEGCMIRGPFSLGEHSTLKMGAKIYGPTTIGPESKVGGEINNSVIFGYSNKAHDGFLGNSVIGEWCNLGADTNNSNLKNNYGQVKIWDMAINDLQSTGLQFCGLLMGDHSKAGINTMFNTGTVTGFCANIFDGGFPPKFIPSYSWGGQKNAPKFELEKAIEVASRVFERRGLNFGEGDKQMFDFLFDF